jgi:hypothetical protein
MNKAEMMFRGFFENGAEYVLFHLAHRVQIEHVSAEGANGRREHWDEVRVLGDDDELAVFDDKPNFIRADATVAIAAYVRRAEGGQSLCAAGARYECHRPMMQGPAQVATFSDGTVVEQYWVDGVRKLKRDLRESKPLERALGVFAPIVL